MDSVPVNWDALDSLVIDFAQSEKLIEDSSTTASPSSSSYHSRLIILQIRRSIEIGHIDQAIDLIGIHAPFILIDHHLAFRLHKQKFIELLRTGSAKARESAFNCLRTSLAPCALDAYPEAYEEFKHVLLTLIYDKDDETSPVANEWSEGKRFDIAGLMSSVLRAHLKAYDPVFSMALRYLISIHQGFCLHQGIMSPISDLTNRLLLEECDPPATPQDKLNEDPPFDNVDILALAHAVKLTRQGAVDSLKFAKGDLFQAFQNELCRVRLDLSVVDELVREYCIYRGFVDNSLGTILASGMHILHESPTHPEAENCFVRNSSIDMEHGKNKNTNCQTSSNNNLMSTQSTDVEVRFTSHTTDNHDDCGTSGTHYLENSRDEQRRGITERNRRKRWKGRHEVEYLPNISYSQTNREDHKVTAPGHNVVLLKEQPTMIGNILCSKNLNNMENKYEILLGIMELAGKGMAAEVVEEVNTLDSDFFVQNPVLLFQLKRVEFLKFVNSGDYSSALKVACSHLGPLASKVPALLKSLKETLVTLLKPNEDTFKQGLPLNCLANSLQVTIGRRLGIEEPQLMKIIKATLHTHNEWFRLQMCRDRFEDLLKIDSLKQVSNSLIGDLASVSNVDTCADGINMSLVESSSPTQVSSRDLMYDETAILKVMEFLALPRAAAIHLLAQYNGNAETVIQQIFT